MKTKPGMAVSFPIASGQMFPGVVVSEEIEVPAQTRSGAKITVTRADVISLRTPRDGGEPYLAFSTETVQFGYTPIMRARLTSVVGLDATPDGEKIDLATLLEQQAANYAEFIASRFAERHAVIDPANL